MAGEKALSDSGQASVELVAIVPALIVAVLVAAQIGVAGWALWSAGTAARAGARAALVGGEPEAAARSALPAPLRERAKVSGDDEIEVWVPVPALLPGMSAVPLEASTALGPGPDDG